MGHAWQRRCQCRGDTLGECDQLTGIGGGVRVTKHRVVAGSFGFENEPPSSDPDQRMEPVTRAHDSCEALARPVASADMFQFVDECPVEVVAVPGWASTGSTIMGCATPQLAGPVAASCSSTSTRRSMPASDASR